MGTWAEILRFAGQWFDTHRRDELNEAHGPSEDVSGPGQFFRQGPIASTSLSAVSDASNESAPPSEISDSEESTTGDTAVLKHYYVHEKDVMPSSHYGYVYSLLLADLPFIGGQVLLSGE